MRNSQSLMLCGLEQEKDQETPFLLYSETELPLRTLFASNNEFAMTHKIQYTHGETLNGKGHEAAKEVLLLRASRSTKPACHIADERASRKNSRGKDGVGAATHPFLAKRGRCSPPRCTSVASLPSRMCFGHPPRLRLGKQSASSDTSCYLRDGSHALDRVEQTRPLGVRMLRSYVPRAEQVATCSDEQHISWLNMKQKNAGMRLV
ncbi:uncharacterized protein FOMMEDRAFT_155365 [Fomitiporia mediterranea MF3/22]|uniref:uncharacterized protein n=1 Tax=Fomitiporia mediterranea (strain MF3/22) TaxID=694068 RepID=UPI000440756E|nr:uncharacterized protein FOMMEDRAFT_155365 [Fomitiporia mediterranea MF3/22]EJD04240.1 hypothetical protein FOMMEDRAFT_155365 [Fomitiporia mediterranea MF3/22]